VVIVDEVVVLLEPFEFVVLTEVELWRFVVPCVDVEALEETAVFEELDAGGLLVETALEFAGEPEVVDDIEPVVEGAPIVEDEFVIISGFDDSGDVEGPCKSDPAPMV
jgi:hypothetical protein